MDVHVRVCSHHFTCVCVCLCVGIKTEGLFRVPGPAAYTEDLIKGFEEGMSMHVTCTSVVFSCRGHWSALFPFLGLVFLLSSQVGLGFVKCPL